MILRNNEEATNDRTFTFRIAAIVLSILVILIAPGLVTSASFAISQPVFGTPVDLSNDTRIAKSPNIQNVGNHIYVAWAEQSAGILFRMSPDDGATWNPPLTSLGLRISSPGGVASAPLISANGTHVYVVWTQTVNKLSQVFFAASSNFGASFTPEVQLTKGRSGANTPVIASWGTTVYVAYDNISTTEAWVMSSTQGGAAGSWTKPFQYAGFHEPQLAAWHTNGYAVGNQGLATTHNRGVTWTNETIPGGNTSGLPSTMSESWIAAWGTNVYAFWETKGDVCSTCSKVNYTVSHDSGNTWTREATLSTTLMDSWAPMVAAFGTNVWVADHTNPGGSKSQVYVYRSTTTGNSWSAPQSLSGLSGDTSFPFNVATTDGKNVFVAWSDQTTVSPQTWVMRVSYSGDGGVTWTPAPGINVSRNPTGTNATDNNDLADGAISSLGTHCYAVWQLIDHGTSQIYFSSS